MYLAGMAYSDVNVLKALADLFAARGSNATITMNDISLAGSIPLITVNRSIKRLRAAGQLDVTISRGRSGGIRRIANDNDAAPRSR